jgi:cyclopropane fatty-acyl-phospholipid synthase-like methyltransferase
MTEATFRYEGVGNSPSSPRRIIGKRYYRRSLRPFIGSSVLEVGAGIGGTTGVLVCGRTSYAGCASSPTRFSRVSSTNAFGSGALPASCECRIGALNSIPDSELYDTVLYIDVLEHIERDRDELERATKHLVPGGHLVVVAPRISGSSARSTKR